MGFALGAGYEFLTRPDAYGALNRAYSIKWTAPPKSMDLGLLYQALGTEASQHGCRQHHRWTAEQTRRDRP